MFQYISETYMFLKTNTCVRYMHKIVHVHVLVFEKLPEYIKHKQTNKQKQKYNRIVAHVHLFIIVYRV